MPSAAEQLEAERAHLADSRDGLGRMRDKADSLVAAGGNAVSTEYLAASLHKRRMSLVDDPSTPLFFGRTDLESPGIGLEHFYIGRRHVADARGDPMVVDWRADISLAFYRASLANPMGLVLRRRFGFDGGQLTAFEDETFTGADSSGESRILTEEIERPRVGPMRDIVATIQPDQDELVRADLGETVCVQGGPGTGKTAVGLHRAAYLLYAHRARLRTGGVLVVGPNAAFLHYIEQVLPALGEVEVTQTTIGSLVAAVPIQGADSPAVERLKGDPRMAAVLRQAVWNNVGRPAETVVVPRGSLRLRLYPSDVADLRDALIARGLRYAASRAVFATMLGSALTAQVEARGEPADDRTVAALARCRPVRLCVDAVLPALDPAAVVFGLFSSASTLGAAADGILTASEQASLLWAVVPKSARSARWTLADAVLIDEVIDLLDRTASFGHVVLDEAQDLSAMQCRAVGRRCSTGSATVLGDLAQGTSPSAVDSWSTTLLHLGKPDGKVRVLERGYRVPREVIDYAALLLPSAAPGVTAPSSIRSIVGALQVRAVRALLPAVVAAVEESLGFAGSVGVIAADVAVARVLAALASAGVAAVLSGAELSGADGDVRVTVVPASTAKGLEFDHVVLVEPAQIAGLDVGGSDPATPGSVDIEARNGLRRLYIALTRAVSGLIVVHAEPLPAALAA
jgi:DNA helicase IV